MVLEQEADPQDRGAKPIKSALKPARPAPGDDAGTPRPAHTASKRVRIRSAENTIHCFQETSETFSPGGVPSDDDECESVLRVLDFTEDEPLRSASVGGARAASASLKKSAAAAGEALASGEAFAATLAWMAVSSLLIFVNKAIMVDWGWRFPFALTALGQFMSAIAGELFRLSFVRGGSRSLRGCIVARRSSCSILDARSESTVLARVVPSHAP